MATNTPTKLRSGKIIDPSMDELSGLFSKSMKFAKPKSKRTQLTEDDMFANMFSNITLGKKIGKSPRKKGMRFTHKKSHKTPKSAGMDLIGGRRRKFRHTNRCGAKRIRTTRVH